MEDELGTVLLERTSRKVLFTQAGLGLVEQAKVVLREVKILREMASSQGKEMAGPMHIGIIPTLGPYLSPLILPKLKSQFPELEIYLYELPTANVIEQLEAGQLDCAILSLAKETEPFIEVPIFNENILLAVSDDHPWAKKEKIDLDQLSDQEILVLDNGHCLRTQIMDYCTTIGAKENERIKVGSLETLRNMVATGAGITLMPELAASSDQNEHSVYLSFNDPKPFRTIGLVYRPGSPLKLRYERLAKMIKTMMEEAQ